MTKTLSLSLLTFSVLSAADVALAPVDVTSTVITEVAGHAKTSADVAQALSDSVPSVDMSRRSGIANDIFIRGQKRDNISVEVDGTKVYGACPNRMDPPISHIVANQIEDIEVIEGPYDVENMGTLSGGVKIKTKNPTKKPQADLHVGFGAFNYKKFAMTGSGGNDFVRLLITASTESSDQYKDGDGNTLAEQLKENAPASNQFKPQYEDMQAYSKKSVKAKAFVTTAKDQELRLSAVANRSNDILYANSSMDAIYDDSNIYSIAYNIDNISKTFTNINLQFYSSDVDHPMSTEYRKKSDMPGMNKTNHMWSKTQGLKLKTSFDLDDYKLLVGLDGSKREWRGEYVNNDTGMVMAPSIDYAETSNAALFSTLYKKFDALSVKMGLRFDSTKVSDKNSAHKDNDYTGVNANIMTKYALTDTSKIFLGVGQASRVPDARELYFMKAGKTVGTPDLKQVTNSEVDAGYELQGEDVDFKLKAFYSDLQNYIYIKKGATQNAFYNIDAFIYGAELSATYYATDALTFDLGASYKHGEKKNALPGQSDKDLADIAPLRGNLKATYEYMHNSTASLDLRASDKWNDVDSDNGEQVLDAWTILNFKLKHQINKKFDFTIGVNNIFDETYAQSNTYADLTLVVTGTSDVMLLNEPGRYFYTNLDFKF